MILKILTKNHKSGRNLIDIHTASVDNFSEETLPSHTVISSVASYLVDNQFLSSKKRRVSTRKTPENSPNSNKKQKNNIMDQNTSENKVNSNLNQESDQIMNDDDDNEFNEDSDEEDNSDDNDYIDFETFKHQYKGHYSCNTVKSVNFYGSNSEYVMSGSDDGKIFIWDKETTEVLNILEGHENVVNCIVYHPFDPMIASSGIDHYVKIWQPHGSFPSEDELKQLLEHNNEICTNNQPYVHGENVESVSSLCTQQ